MHSSEDIPTVPRLATQFLRLALRRAARGTGSQIAFYSQRTAMHQVPDLQSLLGSVRWVLVGDVALRAYMPERATLDVDILIHERDAHVAQMAFLNTGYRFIGTLGIGGFTVELGNEAPIDVLTRHDAWLDTAFAQPVYDQAGIPVLPRAYLILMKLQAGRTQDLADIQRLLALTSTDERVSVRGIVERYSPELIEDLDSLITLADLEFGSPLA